MEIRLTYTIKSGMFASSLQIVSEKASDINIFQMAMS